MSRRELLARVALVLVVVGLPGGLLGYQFLLRPALETNRIIAIESTAPGPQGGGFSPDIVRVNRGEVVTLRFASMDVTHGIAIGPGLDAGIDAVDPGKTGEITLAFDQPGTYTFYCTTWCSPDHWRMRGVIEVVDPDDPTAGTAPQPDAVIAALVAESVDIDAPRDTDAVTQAIPAEVLTGNPDPQSGAQHSTQMILSDLIDPAWRRTHTPLEGWLLLSAANPTAPPDVLRDVVAYLWLDGGSAEPQDTVRERYNQDCAACHGETGQADGPGAAFTAEQPIAFADLAYALSVRDDVLYAKIRRGGMGTDMPNFGTILTPDETWALVYYLRGFAFSSGDPAPSP